MTQLSYHHTSRLTNPAAEALGKALVGHRPGGLSHAIFLSSGSEANESAIKLARQYFVEIGQPERDHIISRHSSYHGNSIGCVSLTGIPVGTPMLPICYMRLIVLKSRRAYFEPLLMPHTSRVSPCNAYRYKHITETDEGYGQRCADELETEILRVGKDRVAAFFAETGKSYFDRKSMLIPIQLLEPLPATLSPSPAIFKLYVAFAIVMASFLY